MTQRAKGLWLVWVLLGAWLAGCGPSEPSLTLYPSRAVPGEEVEARLSGMGGLEARVYVGEVEAEVTARE
ncbi:MAG: peptidase S8, partial [Thermus sp.]|nr:peptidase S8 [Thermus sp.]